MKLAGANAGPRPPCPALPWQAAQAWSNSFLPWLTAAGFPAKGFFWESGTFWENISWALRNSSEASGNFTPGFPFRSCSSLQFTSVTEQMQRACRPHPQPNTFFIQPEGDESIHSFTKEPSENGPCPSLGRWPSTADDRMPAPNPTNQTI